MELYNKIQELLEANKKTRQESISVLELARGTLAKQVKMHFEAKAKELEQRYDQAVQEKINDPQVASDVANNLNKMAAQEVARAMPALERNIQTALLAKIETKALAQSAQESLKEDLRAQIDTKRIFSPEELNVFLERAKGEIVQEFRQSIQTSLFGVWQAQLRSVLAQGQEDLQDALLELKEMGKEVLEAQFLPLVQEEITRLDFSFLKEQHALFYPAIEEHLKEMFLKELERDFMQAYWQDFITDFLNQQAPLKRLKEIEFEAQTHLESLLLGNAVKMLQEQEMAWMQIRLKEWQFKNDVALALKKQELIKQGILQDEWLHTKAYKVN
ncbi:hypothetical protein [Helicobacter mehlei]|uniref:hypothetical protein n=1 Tax=Helicobacter mehlei TaxID=2316080 RepID=UPI001F3146E9|nr:hypothetical protein [Helicobacter mehlei]